jgi:PHD/YefM family antitoxin component YafN of YafNO toxin-antitoxin module
MRLIRRIWEFLLSLEDEDYDLISPARTEKFKEGDDKNA